MTPDAIYACAETLFTAEQTSRQCCLISVAHPKATLDDAYAIQSALVAKKLAAGRKVSGWKIGLTSRAMQSALGITTPDSGVLLDDMHFPNGPTVPPSRFIQPRVEAEIAFVMHASLRGAQVTRADVVAATDDVSASLEIQDTRILRADPATGQTRSIIDTVADNAADAGIVLGTAHHAIDAFDLRWVGVIVSRNGVVEETGLGAGMLNDPVTGILGLVHRLAAYGQGIEAGKVVLAGSFIRPIEAPSGSHFHADYGPFGSVEIAFAQVPTTPSANQTANCCKTASQTAESLMWQSGSINSTFGGQVLRKSRAPSSGVPLPSSRKTTTAGYANGRGDLAAFRAPDASPPHQPDHRSLAPPFAAPLCASAGHPVRPGADGRAEQMVAHLLRGEIHQGSKCAFGGQAFKCAATHAGGVENGDFEPARL